MKLLLNGIEYNKILKKVFERHGFEFVREPTREKNIEIITLELTKEMRLELEKNNLECVREVSCTEHTITIQLKRIKD